MARIKHIPKIKIIEMISNQKCFHDNTMTNLIATRKYKIILSSLTQKSKENPLEGFHNSARKWKRNLFSSSDISEIKRN